MTNDSGSLAMDLGDGITAKWVEGESVEGVMLTHGTHSIFLESDNYANLQKFIEQLKQHWQKQKSSK